MTKALLMCMPDIYQTWHELHIKGPWMGGASIAGNCQNHEVYVGDLILKRDNVKAGVKEAIEMTNPLVIGLSAMTFQYPTAVKIAKHIKSEYPGIPIAIGGYHVTSMRKESQNPEFDKSIDYVFTGEAEHTFNQFLNGEDLANITGLSYQNKKGEWVHNPRHNAICISQGLDSIKPPKRDSRIWNDFHFHHRVFDTAESSRGCDNACKFCSMRTMMPKAGFYSYNIERVVNDLKVAKRRGVESIFFTDDNPAMKPELFKRFLKRLKKEELDTMHYSGMVSTKSMADLETTRLMKSVNFDFAFLGVENVYESTLKGMRKRSNTETATRAIDNMNKSGITILAGIMMGNPEDTEESIRGNFQWFHNHPVDAVMLQYTTPYPGTETRKEFLEEDLIINKDSWSTYNGEFAHCKTRGGMMPQEIETIAYEEYMKLNKSRLGRIVKGKLNFMWNNPKHLFQYYILHEAIPSLRKGFKDRKLTSSEKAKKERERKIAMNQFNI